MVWTTNSSPLPPFLSSNPSDLQMLTNTKRLAWGHLSSLHFVVYLSHCEPNLSGPARQVNHSIDSLPACQRVRVHAGVLERIEGLRRRERDRHMKGSHVVRTVVEDGPRKHCSHYALPKEKKRQSSGNEMTPLDLLSCDIFVFQASDPANMQLKPFPAALIKFPLLIYCIFGCCCSL